MRLWIIRHAHASPASGTTDDAGRPLSERGRRESDAVAAYLALAASPELILHSPYVRAAQTAEYISRRFASVSCAPDDRLTSDRHPRMIVQHLSRIVATEVILVSHEPLTGDLAGWLLSGDLHGRISFSPATVALIDAGETVARGTGVLRSLCPPDILLGKDR